MFHFGGCINSPSSLRVPKQCYSMGSHYTVHRHTEAMLRHAMMCAAKCTSIRHSATTARLRSVSDRTQLKSVELQRPTGPAWLSYGLQDRGIAVRFSSEARDFPL